MAATSIRQPSGRKDIESISTTTHRVEVDPLKALVQKLVTLSKHIRQLCLTMWDAFHTFYAEFTLVIERVL